MTKREQYESKTTALIEPIAQELGFELIDVEYIKEGESFYLRVYIDKEGGVAVNDCETLSNRANPILDSEDYVEGPYIFEVSSPGLTRPLKKERDYKRAMGKLIEIGTYAPVDGERKFYGVLCGYTEKTVKIRGESGEELNFEKRNIALIRLAFKW